MRAYRRFRKGPRGASVALPRWWIELRDHRGIIRRFAGFSDHTLTEELARQVERLCARRAMSEPLDNAQRRFLEGLPEKLASPAWIPDCGPAVFNARLGATVVGAREFLIAYNVNLNTRDRRLAHEIALNIRDTGRLQRDKDGNVVTNPDGTPAKTPGRLKATRALGWYIDEYRQAQVSINLLDFRTTPLHLAFETVKDEAERLGLRVTGSELVGMTPLQTLVDEQHHGPAASWRR